MTSVVYTSNGRWAIDCPICSQVVRVDRHGDRFSFRCYGGCADAELTSALDPALMLELVQVTGKANGNGTAAEALLPALRVVPLAEFAAQEEALAEALLGEDGDAALTPGGSAMVYGDGGAGKTTLLIDGVAHMAAGGEWLGMPVRRPLRVVVIENEGPRAPFRLKWRKKVETWEGPDFVDNVKVVEEPWAGFTFTNPDHAGALAAICDEFEADLLAVGPLITVGVVGAGTPEEVAAFETVLADFRRRLQRPLALWFAHHENKAGDVSGAWERLPDTLLHVRHEEPKRTKVHWRKARWATSLHGQRWTLRWLEEREGFERVEEAERDVPGEIRALWHDEPLRWRTVTEVKAPKDDGGIGRKREDVERALTALVDGGEFECEKGPEGRNANAVCYRPLFLARASKQEKQERPAPVVELVLPDPFPPVREGGRRKTGRAALQTLSATKARPPPPVVAPSIPTAPSPGAATAHR